MAIEPGNGSIQGVIFDLGSTLIRFEGDWEQTLEEMNQALALGLAALGLESRAQDIVADFHAARRDSYQARLEDWAERPAGTLLKQALERHSDAPFPQGTVDGLLERYYQASEQHWFPMPHLHEVLDELQMQGYRMAIISNAADSANVQRLIDNARVRSYFEPIVISASLQIRKPDPRLFEIVLQAWGLPPSQVVMVGDTLASDILGARQSGLWSIWLTAQADRPDNYPHEGKIIPDATAENLKEVPRIISHMGA